MKYLLILLLIFNAFSAVLKPSYSILSQDFNASVIDKDIKDDFVIYHFNSHRHHKSFSSSYLIELFQDHGITLEDQTKTIVRVNQKSHTNFEPIKKKIHDYYKQHYPKMNIKNITIQSNDIFTALPKEYRLIFKSKAFKYANSSLQLEFKGSRQRHFVNYTLEATIKVLKARHNLNRGKILQQIDVLYVREPFKRLTHTPLNFSLQKKLRVKKRINKGKIIYEKDLEPIPDVLKGKSVLVRLINGHVHLEFQAVSVQDASIGDEIYVQKKDKKRLRVKVIGKNLVEIQ